jgi:hypothetical protein
MLVVAALAPAELVPAADGTAAAAAAEGAVELAA